MTTSETSTVRAWHEALNSGDVERLVELSHLDVEMGGPRGMVRGSAVLREWVDRANIRLKPQRVFHRAEMVVVEQQAEWHNAATGEATSAQTVASTFVVRDDRVTSVVRYDGDDALGNALGATGLDESHETSRG